MSTPHQKNPIPKHGLDAALSPPEISGGINHREDGEGCGEYGAMRRVVMGGWRGMWEDARGCGGALQGVWRDAGRMEEWGCRRM